MEPQFELHIIEEVSLTFLVTLKSRFPILKMDPFEGFFGVSRVTRFLSKGHSLSGDLLAYEEDEDAEVG